MLASTTWRATSVAAATCLTRTRSAGSSSAERTGSGSVTTEFMEVWSLEEGDQILVNGNVYKIIDFSCNWSESDEYVFDVVDEEGFVHTIAAEGSKKFRLVLDTTDAVV